MEVSRRGAIAAGVGIGLAGTGGCVSAPGTEKTETRTLTAENATSLAVTNRTGAVTVTGESGRTTVGVTATKRTRFGRAQLGKVSVSANTDDSGRFTLQTTQSGTNVPVSVEYDVRVPPGFRVARLETANGAVKARNVGGDPALRVSNGAVTADGVDGFVTAATTNGAVSVRDVAGLDGASASNGPVTAEVPALRHDSTVRTSNGTVDLSLARDLDATVDARVDNGDVTVRDLPLSNANVGERRVTGTLGAGTYALAVRTSNGRITLEAL